MYNAFIDYVKEINTGDLTDIAWRSDPNFCYVLEHTSPKQGGEYLKLIEAEFPDITYDDIRKYINMNDKYGGTTKSIFTTNKNKMLYCSPSNMRYIYHSLIILTALKESGCSNIVELGAGYGGLCLAISMFQSKMDVKISQYNMIDLPDVGNLIGNYLELNKDGMNFDYDIYDADKFGADVPAGNLFFVSNYCFSELDESIRSNYVNTLIPKVDHGFFVYQTCFGLPLSSFESLLGKTTIKCEQERPQTAPEHVPNWFFYF